MNMHEISELKDLIGTECFYGKYLRVYRTSLKKRDLYYQKKLKDIEFLHLQRIRGEVSNGE